MRRSRWDLAVLLLIAGVMTTVYGTYQRRILAGEGRGWDGKSYFALYEQVRGIAPPAPVQYPFCKRPALPYLAAQVPFDGAAAFQVINVASGLGAIVLTFAALRQTVSGLAALLTTLPLVFYLYSPIRFPFFYPFYVDPPALLLYGVAAFAVARRWFAVAVGALLVSALFRESGLYYALALVVTLAVLREVGRRQVALLAAAGALTVWAGTALQADPCEGSQLALVMENVIGPFGKLDTFMGPLRVASALLMTIGAFLPLARGAEEGGPHRREVGWVFLGLSGVMAVLGGSDTTRLFYAGFPLYAPVLAGWVERGDKLTAVGLALAGLVANGFAKRIPEPAAYAPSNDVTGLFALSPDFAHPGVVAAMVAYWVIVFAVSRRAGANGSARR